MKIGIDARLIHETGVGRYIQNVIRELSVIDHENQYIVFLRKKNFDTFHLPNARWSKRLADVPWHSIQEQFVMPWILMREHLDLVHIPYFNAPIFYPGKYIVTIHDLTIRHFDTGKATTLPYWLYKIRRIGYNVVLSIGMKRAVHIIAVSHAVKNDIVRSFGEDSHKISVTYEGIDPVFLEEDKGKPQVSLPEKYFLYVGNAYPHKNIEVLLDAFVRYKKKVSEPVKLVFVGPSDYFYKRLEKLISSIGLSGDVQFFHEASDLMLRHLYARAEALVFLSLMEGFGLPAIEALVTGCRVICSDIPVFREVLGNLPTYVNPKRADTIAEVLKRISQTDYDRSTLRKNAAFLISKYQWKHMAKETYTLYKRFGQSG